MIHQLGCDGIGHTAGIGYDSRLRGPRPLAPQQLVRRRSSFRGVSGGQHAGCLSSPRQARSRDRRRSERRYRSRSSSRRGTSWQDRITSPTANTCDDTALGISWWSSSPSTSSVACRRSRIRHLRRKPICLPNLHWGSQVLQLSTQAAAAPCKSDG
jgi:hypothetical protein